MGTWHDGKENNKNKTKKKREISKIWQWMQGLGFREKVKIVPYY